MATTINASTSSGLVETADTSGQLELQSNGTTQLTVSSTGAYGQLKSGTAQATTSGTSIDFTSIPSWVKRITVMFSGVSTNGTSSMQIQLGAGSVDTSSYLGSSWTANTTNSNNSTGLLLIATGGSAATNIWHGSAVLTLLGSNTWVMQSILGRSDTATSSIGGGSKVLSGTLDRVRITTVNGTDTFDAGSVNILYEG